jgi:hypothetical protein
MFCSNKHYVSGDFCHLCGETLKEKKVPAKGINKVGKKRSKEIGEYSYKKKIFMEANPQCAVYPHLKAIDIHHIRGRNGDLFLNEDFWLPVSRAGHNWIHENMIEAQKLGFVMLRNVETKEDEKED